MANCQCRACGTCSGCSGCGGCSGCSGCGRCPCAPVSPVEPYVYESTAEWPDLEDLCPNEEAACLLREYLASETGKLTKANEYLYQSGVLSVTNAEIADHMRAVQSVETAHVDRMARVIAALGGDPVFMSTDESDCDYWTAEYMSTARGVRTLLMRNIAAEEALILENRRLIGRIDILPVRSFLRRMAEDDTLHAALHRRLLNELSD